MFRITANRFHHRNRWSGKYEHTKKQRKNQKQNKDIKTKQNSKPEDQIIVPLKNTYKMINI